MPVLAIVGRGHLNGMAYVTQRLVGTVARMVAERRAGLLQEREALTQRMLAGGFSGGEEEDEDEWETDSQE